MKSAKSFAIGILAIALAAVGVVAWKQHQELATLRGNDALSAQERADLQKRLFDAQKRLKELEDRLAATRGRSGDVADAEDADPSASAADKTDRANQRRQQRGPGGFGNVMAMMERPEMQRLMQLQAKAQLDSRYAALFKSLGLSPDQLDKFKNLLVEKQTALQDVMAAARAEGIDPRKDPAGLQKMIASTQADIDASIKQTLGDEAFSQYQQYQQTIPQRSVVNQLQQSLSYTSTPLTETQSAQLVQILAQTTPARPAGTNAAATFTATLTDGAGRGGAAGAAGTLVGVFGGGAAAPISNEAITLSQGVLSASQVTALQQLQAQQLAQQQLQQSLRTAVQGNQGGTTTGGTTRAKTPKT